MRESPSFEPRLRPGFYNFAMMLVLLAFEPELKVTDYMRPFPEAFSSYTSIVTEAERLYYDKKFKLAFRKYDAILKGLEKPDFKKIGYIGIAWCYIGAGQYEDALKMLKKAEFYATSDPQARIMVLMGKGIAHLNLGHYPEAYRQFQWVVDRYRDFKRVWRDAVYFSGLAAYGKGDYKKALEIFNKVLTDKLHFPKKYKYRGDAVLMAALAALKLEEPDKALSYIDQFLKEFSMHPKKPEILLLKAEMLAEAGKYAECLKTYEYLLNTYPGMKDKIVKSMAQVSLKYGDYIVADTTYPIKHELMVDAFLWVPAYEAYKKGDLAKAMPRFLRLVRDYPEDERAAKGLALIAQAFFEQGSYAKTVELCRKYVTQYPSGYDLPKVMLLLAQAHIKQKEWRDAMKVLDELVYRFGTDESKKDVVEKARKLLAALLSEHPEAAQGLAFKTPGLAQEAEFQEAAAAYNRGELQKAAELFLQYAQKHPQDPKACKAYFNAGYVYFQAKDYEKASQILADYAQKCKGENAEIALFYAGAARYFLKDYQGAVQLLTQFVNSYPASDYKPNALKLLGLAYIEGGNRDTGVQYLKEAARTFRARGNPDEAKKIEDYLKGIGAQ